MRHTKIVATISDRNCSASFLRELSKAGMDVIRVNTAHQEPADTLKILQEARAVDPHIPILLDTKGPEVRTADITRKLQDGDIVTIGKDIPVSYDRFVEDVPVGATILIDDGALILDVEQKDALLHCRVRQGGLLDGRKSVNVPGVHLRLPPLSEKDKAYLKFAAEHDLTFVAHSFVRNAEDVKMVQAFLDQYGAKTQIIAKIENEEGVRNIEEILPHVFGVMVARGDLGVEIPQERVPLVQKELVKKCRVYGKLVIVATQMLHSMIEHARPTRAELSDVANAVLDGADAVMLSGETTKGKHPVLAVETMARIVVEAEKHAAEKQDPPPAIQWKNDQHKFLAGVAIRATKELPVSAIVTFTRSGATARLLAAYRSPKPVYAFCTDDHVTRALKLLYGVHPYGGEGDALERLRREGRLEANDLVVILGGGAEERAGANYLKIVKALPHAVEHDSHP